jgi:hypothetical protein
MSVTGGCLCGRVRYRLAQPPNAVYFCHCRQCQQAQGSAFVASVPVSADDFSLLAGEPFLKAYRSSPIKARYFCGECGAPIYSRVDGKPMLRIRAGSLDPPVDLKLQAHIHTASQASWFDIRDDSPRYPGQEPGRR